MDAHISESAIYGIQLYVRTNEENRIESNVEINNKELHATDGAPYRGGPYDLHMGTVDLEYRCSTCGNKKKNCPGHSGHMELRYPAPNPLFIKDIRRWLKVICFNCGALCVKKIPVGIHRRLILQQTVSMNNNDKDKECPQCKHKNPHIIPNPADQMGFLAVYYDGKDIDKKRNKPERIHVHEIGMYFDRITDETLEQMGKSQHPRNFVIDVLYISPNTVRPETKSVGGDRSRTDDITALLQNIVLYNQILPEEIPIESKELMAAYLQSHDKTISNLQLAIYEMIKGSSMTDKKKLVGYGTKPLASIARRMPRKFGRVRRHLMGSRAINTARSFITDDNSLAIDEVGLPLSVAREIQIEEVVRYYNRDRLMIYFKNGRDRYPGCTKIMKASTGKIHTIGYISRDFELEEGDVIYRDIIDGDVANFNRQPSLLPSNISANRLRVINKGETFRFNVFGCPLYNADFDGDAMTLIFMSDIMPRIEASLLSSVSDRFMNFTNSSPAIGLFQDALIGIAKLTCNDIKMTKFHAMQMLGQIDEFPAFDKAHYSGRDLVSLLLPPINYEAKPKYYEPNYGHVIKYDPTDIKVVIKDGKLLSGILDKPSIGQNAHGGILHIIHSEYGARKALDVTFNLQQLTTMFLFQRGCTIGIREMILPNKVIDEEIHPIISQIIYDANRITKRLDSGGIVPPLGKTVGEFYEELMLNALQSSDDFVEPVLKNIDPQYNEFYWLVATGSKGDFGKILNTVSSIGLVTIAGKRIEQKFGFRRSLPYFTSFDTSPQSRGYLTNSYMSGQKVQEMIFHAMDARYALIQKGLSVSLVGEQNRKAIKNLESIIVDNHFRASKGNSNIVQMAYGDDCADTRYVEKNKFPTVMCSEEDLKKNYKSVAKDFPKWKKNADKLDEYLLKEYDQIVADRNTYRDIFMKIESQSNELFSDSKMVPFNIKRIISNVVNSMGSSKVETLTDPIECIKMVAEFCEDMPYVFFNEGMRRRKAKFADRFRGCLTLSSILVRSYLCTKQLIAKNVNETLLRMILDRIYITYKSALVDFGTAVGIIAAQSISEPMTQMVLNSHHRSGGAGSKTTGIERIKEIMGAKDTGSGKNAKSKPTMNLLPIEKYLYDKEKVTEIANYIEMLAIRYFVKNWSIFFETYGDPVHPLYKKEKQMITTFEKMNKLIKPPTDLSKWCIRFELIKENLIFKHITLEAIYLKLRTIFPKTYIVYNAQNADVIVMRIYIRTTHFKKSATITMDQVLSLKDKILDTIARGIDGIISATVNDNQMARSYIKEDGSIDTRKIYNIMCDGSNISGVMNNPYIDSKSINSDNIKEVERMFGIEAARYKIISEIREIIKGENYRHYTIYADEMTYTGSVTSIERSGLGVRELENIMLRVSNEAPIMVLEDSAVNGMKDILKGVSAPLSVGAAPKLGSLYNQIFIDEDAVKKRTHSVDDMISALKT